MNTKKTLMRLNDQLTQLPKSSLNNLSGGIVETRRTNWTAHGDHEDNDGWGRDLHA